MKQTKKPKVPKTVVKEAEKTVCANPRYEGLTIAEATRRMMQKKPPK